MSNNVALVHMVQACHEVYIQPYIQHSLPTSLSKQILASNNNLYEKHLVGKSDGYLRAFQSAARLADKRRLAEQDAITQAATSGSFAGTPWEKNGQTGSLINL